MPTDDETVITEISEFEPSRVDGVGKGANGFPILMLKSIDGETTETEATLDDVLAELDKAEADDRPPCSLCKGSGKIKEGHVTCPKCKGSGVKPMPGDTEKSLRELAARKEAGVADSGSGATPAKNCGTCKGVGMIDLGPNEKSCPDCGGTGQDQATTNPSELHAVDGDAGSITVGAGGREIVDKALAEYGIELDDYVVKRNFDAGTGGGVDRDKIPAADFAGPKNADGDLTYPIVIPKDVHDAASLIGHADNPDAVKAKIKAIAKRKGADFVAQLPDDWKNDATKASLDEELAKDWATWNAEHRGQIGAQVREARDSYKQFSPRATGDDAFGKKTVQEHLNSAANFAKIGDRLHNSGDKDGADEAYQSAHNSLKQADESVRRDSPYHPSKVDSSFKNVYKADGSVFTAPNPQLAAAATQVSDAGSGDDDGSDDGDASMPGSPAWEAVDAQTATDAAMALMTAAELIRQFGQREMQEVAAGEGNDIFDAGAAQAAMCGVSDALGIMAQMAFHEGLEAAKSIEDNESELLLAKDWATWDAEHGGSGDRDYKAASKAASAATRNAGNKHTAVAHAQAAEAHMEAARAASNSRGTDADKKVAFDHHVKMAQTHNDTAYMASKSEKQSLNAVQRNHTLQNEFGAAAKSLRKAGRRLSSQTVDLLATARDKAKDLSNHLTGVLGDDDPAKTSDAGKPASAFINNANKALLSKEIDDMTGEELLQLMEERDEARRAAKASKGKSVSDQTDSVASAKDANSKAKTKDPKEDDDDLEDEVDQGDNDSASGVRDADGGAKSVQLTQEEIEANEVAKQARKDLKAAKKAKKEAAAKAALTKSIEESLKTVVEQNEVLKSTVEALTGDLESVKKLAAPSTIVRTRTPEAITKSAERDALDLELAKYERIAKSHENMDYRRECNERAKALRVKIAAMSS